MKQKQFILVLALISFFAAKAQQVHQVPGNFPTIQQAVNAAKEGDTVLVAPGIYYENVQLQGRNIVLTSTYYKSADPAATIRATVIDGSQPVHPDTASCMLIWKGEGASTVVQGFTLQGGKGTVWYDHYVPGYFREGGAILSEFSSPTIRHNIIQNNTVSLPGAGTISNGGGGIRCGDGVPLIENNLISHNTAAGYGGGVVLNYCPGAMVRNNIIAFNTGGKDYSGGGFWCTGSGQNEVITLQNNTIAYNHSLDNAGQYGGKAGGVWLFSAQLNVWNNIIWGNTQQSGKPIAKQGGAFDLKYNCIETGIAGGTGSISADPLFRDTVAFFLEAGSPAIDAGNPDAAFADFSKNNRRAAFPARGEIRSDLGAYGGQNISQPALANSFQTNALFSKVQNSPVVIPPSDSRSVNWVDIDNDHDLDLMITNGKQGGENNFLYRNNGSGAFDSITDDVIVQDGKPSDGASWADYDNDGAIDCYVVNWYNEKNLLYHNNGDGSFTAITAELPASEPSYSETASWGDMDNNGRLDLYVTNSDGNKRNFLYRNTGDGHFEKITTGTPVTDVFISRCVNWTDFDNDGDADIFVTNESNQNEQLYRNNGDGTFTKVSGEPLISAGGKTMSASWGDMDNDGDQDVFLANDQGDNKLFLNAGDGHFTAITTGPVVSSGGNSFGSAFGDVDNDGDLDLFVTNAFWGGPWRNFLFLNQGDGTFLRDTTEIPATDEGWSYGTAFGDWDNDGDLDLGVANCYNAVQTNSLYENHAAELANHWMVIECTGNQSNTAAIGAKVFVTAIINGVIQTQMREISAQSGYCGQNQLGAHFGLGNAPGIDHITVQWPSGIEEVFGNVAMDQYIRITEGNGINITQQPVFQKNILSVMPNPFRDTVQISFELPAHAAVQLVVQNSAGQTVYRSVPKSLAQGAHHLEWAAGENNAGIYQIQLEVNGAAYTKAILKI